VATLLALHNTPLYNSVTYGVFKEEAESFVAVEASDGLTQNAGVL
jgi:hypothetical protein